jgi:hypothetical protein
MLEVAFQTYTHTLGTDYLSAILGLRRFCVLGMEPGLASWESCLDVFLISSELYDSKFLEYFKYVEYLNSLKNLKYSKYVEHVEYVMSR